MTLNFFDIPVTVDFKGYVYKAGLPVEVYRKNIIEENDFNLSDLEEYIKKDLIYNKKFTEALKIDRRYYILKDCKEIFGIISLHKGYTFIDYAEHDDRVIIKCGFPHLKCDIIGE